MAKQIPFKIKEEKWTDTKCRCGHVFSKGCGFYERCPECFIGIPHDWNPINKE